MSLQLDANVRKVIIPLEGHGQRFKMVLRNLGISEQRDNVAFQSRSHLDTVYNECVSQILMIYSDDVVKTLNMLRVLPDLQFFAHIPQLSNRFDNQLAIAEFSQAFKIFATDFIFIIKRMFGNEHNVDYLLEAVADDYAVLYRDAKGP